MKPLVALTVLLAIAEANLFWGSCPNPDVVSSVDLEQFSGQWYEMARTTRVPYTATNDCNRAQYYLVNGEIAVENCTYEADNDAYRCVNGEAYCTNGSGDCHVRFSKWAPWGNYTILDIDYNNYLAVWSCTNFYIFNIQYSWLLARDSDSNALPTLEVFTTQTSLTETDFVSTNQSNCPDREDDDHLMTYNGDVGDTYDDSNYVRADKSVYAFAEEDLDVAAHPSYSIQTPAGNLLLSGDSYGDGDGRGWANLFDHNAKFKWAWHSDHSKFDAILGAAVLSDETVILGGTRSATGTWRTTWELLLVAVGSDGTEKWTTTIDLHSPNPPNKDGWSVIYWVDVDPTNELLLVGGVCDHQRGEDTILWKSGGG